VIKDSIGIRNRFLNQLFNENNLVSNWSMHGNTKPVLDLRNTMK
jgi:hypothetical protein